LKRKLAEHWIGGPLPTFGESFDMEQGKILEEEARPFFTLTTGLEAEKVGFIASDDDRAGCSPDGWGDGFGVEIKCPRLDTHIGYLLNGELPDIYAAQVQFSLYVTGAKSWHFLSYRRNFPPLLIEVKPDESAFAAFKSALTAFNAAFDEGLAKLVKLNGGAPSPRHRGNVPFRMPTNTAGFDLIP